MNKTLQSALTDKFLQHINQLIENLQKIKTNIQNYSTNETFYQDIYAQYTTVVPKQYLKNSVSHIDLLDKDEKGVQTCSPAEQELLRDIFAEWKGIDITCEPKRFEVSDSRGTLSSSSTNNAAMSSNMMNSILERIDQQSQNTNRKFMLMQEELVKFKKDQPPSSKKASISANQDMINMNSVASLSQNNDSFRQQTIMDCGKKALNGENRDSNNNRGSDVDKQFQQPMNTPMQKLSEVQLNLLTKSSGSSGMPITLKTFGTKPPPLPQSIQDHQLQVKDFGQQLNNNMNMYTAQNRQINLQPPVPMPIQVEPSQQSSFLQVDQLPLPPILQDFGSKQISTMKKPTTLYDQNFEQPSTNQSSIPKIEQPIVQNTANCILKTINLTTSKKVGIPGTYVPKTTITPIRYITLNPEESEQRLKHHVNMPVAFQVKVPIAHKYYDLMAEIANSSETKPDPQFAHSQFHRKLRLTLLEEGKQCDVCMLWFAGGHVKTHKYQIHNEKTRPASSFRTLSYYFLVVDGIYWCTLGCDVSSNTKLEMLKHLKQHPEKMLNAWGYALMLIDTEIRAYGEEP